MKHSRIFTERQIVIIEVTASLLQEANKPVVCNEYSRLQLVNGVQYWVNVTSSGKITVTEKNSNKVLLDPNPEKDSFVTLALEKILYMTCIEGALDD